MTDGIVEYCMCVVEDTFSARPQVCLPNGADGSDKGRCALRRTRRCDSLPGGQHMDHRKTLARR